MKILSKKRRHNFQKSTKPSLELKSGVSTTRSRKVWGICSAETCRSQNYMSRDKIGPRCEWCDNDART